MFGGIINFLKKLYFSIYWFFLAVYITICDLELHRKIFVCFQKTIDHEKRLKEEIEKYKKSESYETNKNKWCIITGSNSGIGKVSAKILSENEYNVILACKKNK
jgi:hypothetical protein